MYIWEMACSVFQFTDFREFLKAVLEERKGHSRGWSHRFIADRIGLKSGGHISLILNGKANLKDRALEALVDLLKLSPSEGLYFRNLVHYNQAMTHEEQKHWFSRMNESRDSSVTVLDVSQYVYYSRWYYPAVREALTVFDFSGSEYQQLGAKMLPVLSAAEVHEAIDLLIRLKLIAKDAKGYFRSVDSILTTGPQLNGFYFREYVQNILELARSASQNVAAGEKYNSWISMAISRESFQKVVEETRLFRKRILKIIEQEENADRAYLLNMNLFPITERKRRKKS